MLAKFRSTSSRHVRATARQLLAVALLILLAGCRPDRLDESLLAPVQTAIQPPAMQPPATPTVTPTPLVTGYGEGRPYYLVVSYANEITADDLDSGQKRISVVATIGTTAAQPMTIGLDSLVLLDDDGVAYPANPPQETPQPALPGYTLSAEESIYGFVNFDIPADATPLRLIWCVEGAYPCAAPFSSEIQ